MAEENQTRIDGPSDIVVQKMNCKCGMAMEVHTEDFATKSAVCPSGHRTYLFRHGDTWETAEERMARLRTWFICRRCGEKAFDYSEHEHDKVCGGCYGKIAEEKVARFQSAAQMRHITSLKKRSNSLWAQFNFVNHE